MARILIVDDDAAVRGFFRTVLEKLLGFSVIEADSVSGAFKSLSVSCPDLIFLDSNLPDGTAKDFCLKLKKIYPAALAIPKLIISGVRKADGEDLDWQTFGIKDYLVKPCSIDDIKDTVNRCLKKS